MIPIHPIAIVDQVISEYERHLSTEFRARDNRLRQALVQALERPQFLAQEPFFQAHRPFKAGAQWQDLPIDARLARVMEARSESKTAYLHQSEAIAHLLGPNATSLVVTTGTGSGKTECFLLPVIQNAIEDSTRHKHSALTAILVYPMNALANDQEARIREYLEASGHTHVKVARYDRTTQQDEREALRRSPPHILLTNYMMLEYLLVRPADREAIFANNRCRFLVLDEVHSYRGALGANIALLFRRLRAHLKSPRNPLAVATSATIKSMEETGRSEDEVRRLRDLAVQEFVGKLTGYPSESFRILGEELLPLAVPAQARWTPSPASVAIPKPGDRDGARKTLAALAGLPADAPLDEAMKHAGILWHLSSVLARKPMSVSGIAQGIRAEITGRSSAPLEAVEREVRAALYAGATVADQPGGLRLRAHRFIRGGWKFHRCVSASCGCLYPMGEATCACGCATAPLLLCRACGADALLFAGSSDPSQTPLQPGKPEDESEEWVLYDRSSQENDDDEDEHEGPKEMGGRKVFHGSFEPNALAFSPDETAYPHKVSLVPKRTKCFVCGSTAGRFAVMTPVALGTSAAVRVLAEGVVDSLGEAHAKGDGASDDKERVLIFADSRQDASHQARFITYAGRYDRMRRRLVRLLEGAGGALRFSDLARGLMVEGFSNRDNEHFRDSRARDVKFVGPQTQEAALAWEEAPLLDDLAVMASYRATIAQLGLVGVRYPMLESYVLEHGQDLCSRFGLSPTQLHYLARCVLEEMRTKSAFARPLLQFHPAANACPDSVKAAAWERKLKSPVGYPCDERGRPLASIDRARIPEGIVVVNPWRASKQGRAPRMQRMFSDLVRSMGNTDVTEADMVALLDFLVGGSMVVPAKIHGYRNETREMLQASAEVELVLLRDGDRARCTNCGLRMPWVAEGAPCRGCGRDMGQWPAQDVEASRYVQRIRAESSVPLVAGEHTAQITGDVRKKLEDDFKARGEVSPVNVLSCSPTLEMGIDVGGLDAVLMRNVPPRPDNYAQRGGRAGRRSRVGVVIGYARSTPHDQYFYDRPEEMIAGEVAAPGVGLSNRDVVVRHLNAIAFGLAEPGLAGRMAEYVTFQGDAIPTAIGGFLDAFEARIEAAAELALDAWGPEVLGPLRLATKEDLVAVLRDQIPRVRDVFDRTRFQIQKLHEQAKPLFEQGQQKHLAIGALELINRILGLKSERGGEADDRGSGNPMRRFAEFGVLPGYEFPSEPATLRLREDEHEEEPVAVARRFGLSQFQPDAPVYARRQRWKVDGLDTSSPWNPASQEPGWLYRLCGTCNLRFHAQTPTCPRCHAADGSGRESPGFEFGGFVARRDDSPILEEEDRFARSTAVRCAPQWDGDVYARYLLDVGWLIELRHGESIRWVNEWKPPLPTEKHCTLRDDARGFYLCPHCGRVLKPGAPPPPPAKGKKAHAPPRRAGTESYNHAKTCPKLGKPPEPLALTTQTPATTLRLLVDLPVDFDDQKFGTWGLSLGYSLRTGMRQLYMLDGSELEFELEGPWPISRDGRSWKRGALTFIDAAVGGSGFLERVAEDLHLVAARSLDHLKHDRCDRACYRCLKTYQNQRFHAQLSWPDILDTLTSMAIQKPARLPRRKWDVFDPKPWIDAYEAGVGSPLELAFLRMFQAAGIVVQKQVPIAPTAGTPPFTVADFAIPERRVAIYVDGAVFHVGGNLRRDGQIRERLKALTPPWTVVVLTARDLDGGDSSLRDLFGGFAFPTVPPPKFMSRPPPAEDDAWEQILAIVDKKWLALGRSLRDAGVPAPEDADIDLVYKRRTTGGRAVFLWERGGRRVLLAPAGAQADDVLVELVEPYVSTEIAQQIVKELEEGAP